MREWLRVDPSTREQKTATYGRRFARLSTALAIAAALPGPGLAGQQRAVQQPDLRYEVEVDLVRLSVTARDAQGKFVPDLVREDFQVLEDGVPQEIAHFGHLEAPISVVLLFDKSASMQDEKLMHAKDGVINFVRALRAEDEVLIITFSRSIDVLGGFGLDRKTIERATKEMEVESSTRLYDAVIEASQVIATPERKDKRAIFILSDGEDTASTETLEQAEEAVKSAAVPVYAIGIQMEEERSLWPSTRQLLGIPRGPSAIDALKRLTDGTGGWTYPIVAAKRCKEVCLRVADELRNQYLLGYPPANRARDGGWRAITVRTTRPGVTLATRAGYYGPGLERTGRKPMRVGHPLVRETH